LAKRILSTFAVQQMWCSATMPNNISDTHTLMPLNTAQVWKTAVYSETRPNIQGIHEMVPNYLQYCSNLINSLPAVSKVLVFVQTIKDANLLASQFPNQAVVLSGGSDTSLLDGKRIIVSTSVADVGITIPSVDTVVSSDIGIHVSHDLFNSQVVWYRLSVAELAQRRGRTGRTNHGQFFLVKYPDAMVREVQTGLNSPGAILSLLQSGIPVKILALHLREPLCELMGLNDVEGPVRNDLVAEAFEQLHRYSSNIRTLLVERAEASELTTNTGEAAAMLDNARMGLVRKSTSTSSGALTVAIVKVCSALGKMAFTSGDRKEHWAEQVRKESSILLGNIKCRSPFPDPELGEWGMDIEIEE
jgi:hypothetical protein